MRDLTHMAQLKTAGWLVALCMLALISYFYIAQTSNIPKPNNIPGLAFRRALLTKIMEKDHEFIPASSEHIHGGGSLHHRDGGKTHRFLVAALQQSMKFPLMPLIGSYLDFVAVNTTSIYISLHNSASSTKDEAISEAETPLLRMSLRPDVSSAKPAAPISLLARIDHGKHVYFPGRGHGLVAISTISLNASCEHNFRVSYIGPYQRSTGVVQFEGIWLSRGGILRPNAGQVPDKVDQRGEVAKGVVSLLQKDEHPRTSHHRKLVEILTDISTGGSGRYGAGTVVNDHQGTLSFISSWQYQLASKFDIDHITLPAQDTCLSKKCFRTSSHSNQITPQDIFFRSGPPRTSLFSRPWSFQRYTPDVVLLDLGRMDFSLANQPSNQDQPHQSHSTLLHAFTTAYTDLIFSIRKSAYPLHRAYMSSDLSDGYIYNSAPSTLPIFVMLPFAAPPLLAHTLRSIVQSVRKEGDIATFFLDTTGWLSNDDDFEPLSAPTATPGSESRIEEHVALSVKGHMKAAAFLQMHLCPYLSTDDEAESCPFRRYEVYDGRVIVPQEAELEKAVLENKIWKVKAMFGVED